MKKKNVLILCPHFSQKGGVAHYYSLVRKHFASERVSLRFYYTGYDTTNGNTQNRILKFLSDLSSLIRLYPQYDLVVLNPSLDTRAVMRDGIYHFIAKRLFRRKTLIFFRGWMPEFERVIDRYGKTVFSFFFNPEKLIVLSKNIMQQLKLWGFDPENIILETTTFEEHGIKIEQDRFKIIFLSRFSKNKGCLEAIQTIEQMVHTFPNLKLFMAGDGELSSELKTYVTDHNLHKNVEFTGWIENKTKSNLLSQCGIMLYPTSYGEGMPNSLIEGMGSGLVLITRPVAGIADIVVNGENGFLVESLDPEVFALHLTHLFQNRKVWKRMSEQSRQIAKSRFEIGNVVKRLEKIYFEAAQ